MDIFSDKKYIYVEEVFAITVSIRSCDTTSSVTFKKGLWSNSELDILKNYYPKGGSNLCKVLGRNWCAIAKRAFDLGLKREVDSCSWTKEEEDIIRNYLLTEKQDVIESYLPNRSWSAILQKGLKMGIYRDFSTSHKISKGYVFNDDFFSKWTPEMDWVLGWIITDGSIQRDSNRLKIELNKKDIDVLYKIGNLLMYDGLIVREDIKRSTAYLSLNNKKFIDDLRTLGIHPSKTWNVRVPDMPKNCYRHFIRGFIEGDGSVTIGHPQGYTIMYISMIGNKHTITKIHSIINESLGLNIGVSEIQYKNGVLYMLRYFGRNAVDLGEWIYSDVPSNLKLDRKYEYYINFMNTVGNKRFKGGNM